MVRALGVASFERKLRNLLLPIIEERGIRDYDLARAMLWHPDAVTALRARVRWSVPTALHIAHVLDVEILPTVVDAFSAEQMLQRAHAGHELTDAEVAHLSGVHRQIGEYLSL